MVKNVNEEGENISESIMFENNSLLPLLYGDGDGNLSRIEKNLNVQTASRGNILSVTGAPEAVHKGKKVLKGLYAKLEQGMEIGPPQVDAELRMTSLDSENRANGRSDRASFGESCIKTMKKAVMPYSQVQAEYVEALQAHDLVFALGPAGTGKTYLAVAMAVSLFLEHKVDRIILSRPAVEAGEKLGFLPGDLKEKVDPYMRPLYDALFDMMPAEKVMHHMENGEIEIAPLAFMRGRTLSNAYIILDEAQNATATQMKMFLTRLGENSRMAVTGDLSQLDLPRDVKSGLSDAIRKVEPIEGIECIRFSKSDVVRHDLAAKIVDAYEEWERKKRRRLEDRGGESEN